MINVAQSVIRIGTASVPATCGELVQGLYEGKPCLVSCPIDCYSTATVGIDTENIFSPTEMEKSVRALALGLKQCNHHTHFSLSIKSNIPRSRGYGSSTADISASLYALGNALGKPFQADEVAKLAVAIEPSDSTMFPGLTLFDHLEGSFYECLGKPPTIPILVIDPGGTVDTIAFNQRDFRQHLKRLEKDHAKAFALLREGISHGDAEEIAAATTLSAIAHQCILPNSLLELILDLCKQTGALGICRAHSGTILGIILDINKNDPSDIALYCRNKLSGLAQIYKHCLVGGGNYSINPYS